MHNDTRCASRSIVYPGIEPKHLNSAKHYGIRMKTLGSVSFAVHLHRDTCRSWRSSYWIAGGLSAAKHLRVNALRLPPARKYPPNE